MSKSDDNEQKQRLEKALGYYRQSVCQAIDDLAGAIQQLPEPQSARSSQQPLPEPNATLPKQGFESKDVDHHKHRVWWLGGLLMLLIIFMIWTRVYQPQPTVAPITPPKALATQHQSAPSRV